jgi:hypothetical protein
MSNCYPSKLQTIKNSNKFIIIENKWSNQIQFIINVVSMYCSNFRDNMGKISRAHDGYFASKQWTKYNTIKLKWEIKI